MKNQLHLMILQRILHGKCLDELLRADKTQSVLKAERKLSAQLTEIYEVDDEEEREDE